jgi:hypothetical protein
LGYLCGGSAGLWVECAAKNFETAQREVLLLGSKGIHTITSRLIKIALNAAGREKRINLSGQKCLIGRTKSGKLIKALVFEADSLLEQGGRSGLLGLLFGDTTETGEVEVGGATLQALSSTQTLEAGLRNVGHAALKVLARLQASQTQKAEFRDALCETLCLPELA